MQSVILRLNPESISTCLTCIEPGSSLWKRNACFSSSLELEDFWGQAQKVRESNWGQMAGGSAVLPGRSVMSPVWRCVGWEHETVMNRNERSQSRITREREIQLIHTNHKAGLLINTKPSSAAERSNVSEWKWLRCALGSVCGGCSVAHSPICPVAMMLRNLGCWLTVRQRMSSVCSR